MNEPSKIPVGFAVSGDKNSIPETTTTPGAASWSLGFPSVTSVPVSQGGISPSRADFNGIFNALSLGLMWVQQGNHYAYDDTINYNPGALVSSVGSLYFCKQANGPDSSIVAPGDDDDIWGLLLDSNGNSTINTSGHAGNATRATQDGEGNVITSTYLTINGAADEYLTQSDASDTYLSQTDAATTYATKEEDAAKLPLTGGTMTGSLRNNESYAPFIGRVKNNLTTSGAYCDIFRVEKESSTTILSRPRFSYNGNVLSCNWLFKSDVNESTLKLYADGGLFWNDKVIECATEKGDGYLKLSDGRQFCFGTTTINNTAGINVSYPRAFKTAPIVVAIPVGSTTFNLHVAVGSRTTTAFNATGYNNAGTAVSWITCSYIAIGEGVD